MYSPYCTMYRHFKKACWDIRGGYSDRQHTNKSRWKIVLCAVIQICRCMPSYNAVELIIRGIWATGNIITYPCRNSRRNALQANRRHCIALLEVSGKLWLLPILRQFKIQPFLEGLMSKGIIILLTAVSGIVERLRATTTHSKSLLQYFNYQTLTKSAVSDKIAL